MKYFDQAWKVQADSNKAGIPAIFGYGQDGYTVVILNPDGNRTVWTFPKDQEVA